MNTLYLTSGLVSVSLQFLSIPRRREPCARVKDDIVWRKLEEIREHVLAVAWVPLEQIIKTIYQDSSLPDIGEAERFFAERNLWIH